jgi:hypothetical protein
MPGWPRTIGAIAIALGATACSVSPVPEPPEPRPTLNSDIQIDFCLTCLDFRVLLHGQPGSAKDATEVWGTNLDRGFVPVGTSTESDGSFLLRIDALDSDEIRLQARRGELRSVPLDFVLALSAGVSLQPAVRPFAECFQAPLELELGSVRIGESASRSLTLRSSCPSELSIESIGLRVPNAAVSIQAPFVPLLLASGGSLDLDVHFSPSRDLQIEEILSIEISGPERDRRPITLFGRTPR